MTKDAPSLQQPTQQHVAAMNPQAPVTHLASLTQDTPSLQKSARHSVTTISPQTPATPGSPDYITADYIDGLEEGVEEEEEEEGEEGVNNLENLVDKEQEEARTVRPRVCSLPRRLRSARLLGVHNL